MEIEQREYKLREALKQDRQFQVKEGTSVEVAQVSPLVHYWIIDDKVSEQSTSRYLWSDCNVDILGKLSPF